MSAKAPACATAVSSYFLPSTKLEKKKVGLLEHVVEFDFLETETEVEALLAENRLIKDIQPNTTPGYWMINFSVLDDYG